MTVLQVLPALDAGGVERGTVELAAELVRRGHRALVVSGPGRLRETLLADGGKHWSWPIGRKSLLTLTLVRKLRRLLAEQRVDILHARSRVPAWIAYLAWRTMPRAERPRFVTTVHGLYSVNRYSAIMLRGERVIAVSDTVRGYIEAHYHGTDLGRVRVVPRGVAADEFPHAHTPDAAWLERWHRDFPELRGCTVLTLPARLTRLKGHRDFFAVLQRVQSRGLEVHGLAVGGTRQDRDAYSARLIRTASERALPIRFTGHRDDICDIYAASDIVLSLSQQPESFGRTVLEALSVGVPVVGYDHGGVGEVLREMFPRGAVPPGDIEAVVDKVCELSCQPTVVPPHRAFPLEYTLEQTLALYEELLGSPEIGAAAGDTPN